MSRSSTLHALTLCALSSAAFAGGTDAPAIVRGYTLTGEVMLYAPLDQHLPAGWTVACDSKARSLKLHGLYECEPLLYKNRLYFGTSIGPECLSCVDLVTKKVLWTRGREGRQRCGAIKVSDHRACG